MRYMDSVHLTQKKWCFVDRMSKTTTFRRWISEFSSPGEHIPVWSPPSRIPSLPQVISGPPSLQSSLYSDHQFTSSESDTLAPLLGPKSQLLPFFRNHLSWFVLFENGWLAIISAISRCVRLDQDVLVLERNAVCALIGRSKNIEDSHWSEVRMWMDLFGSKSR